MVAAIITARAGSKGLPGKNMLDLGGIPLIEHTFIQAIASSAFDCIYLNTDLDEAIDLAQSKYPEIQVAFKRPEWLAMDKTSHKELIEHHIEYLVSLGKEIDQIVVLQPTTPFKLAKELATGVQMLRDGASSVLGVSKVMHHPAEYLYRNSTGEISYLMEDFKGKRRQEYPTIYFDNGAFYGFSLNFFKETGCFFNEKSELLEMGEWSLIDIDTQFELDLARGLLEVNKKEIYV
jgi:CMP-N,N'-diacetyllegionaminic acid synthase